MSLHTFYLNLLDLKLNNKPGPSKQVILNCSDCLWVRVGVFQRNSRVPVI